MKKQILYWTPRILAILAILFLMLFSADCVDFQDWKKVLVCFIMHNIPAFIVAAITLVAWKWELAGGLLLVLVSLSGGMILGAFAGNPWALIFVVPFLIAGILFIIHHIHYGNIAGSDNPQI